MVRIKQRYILGELIFANGNLVDAKSLTQKKLQEYFRVAVQDAFGDVGIAQVQPNFIVKFWNVTTRIFILRVGRENIDTAVNSLVLMTEMREYDQPEDVAGEQCRVRILHIGGTLEKVEQQYKKLSEAWLESTQKKIESHA